jgi:hypothetical protein
LDDFANHPVAALQIGAFTGDASEWLLTNALAHPQSRLVDVDTWQGSGEEAHNDIDWPQLRDFYAKRLWGFLETGKLVPFQKTSDAFFAENSEKFDFIYIDGDHRAGSVVKDAINAWSALNSGGVLAFDDYTWSAGSTPEQDPKLAIDAFLLSKTNGYNLLAINNQVWLRKH